MKTIKLVLHERLLLRKLSLDEDCIDVYYDDSKNTVNTVTADITRRKSVNVIHSNTPIRCYSEPII